jgi:glycosyltransferase involved in cell wall biosynthesis
MISIANAPLRQEQEIRQSWDSDAPVLSMVCISYNHAAFIAQTLTGFLQQRTHFPFEIICYDDCSTDNSREIVTDFQQRYPSLIKTIFPDENQRSKGFKPFIDFVLPQCKGAYIARCEGDDYWVDPDKVEKQVSFLQQHPQYVLATHDIHTVDEHNQLISTGHLADFYKKDFNSKALRCGWAGPVTQSILFRNVLKSFPPEFRKTYLGDAFLASLLGQYGDAKYMADIKPSMYRIHSGGVFSPLALSDKFDMQAYSFFWMYKYYKRIGMDEEARIYKLKSLEKLHRDLSVRDWWRLFLVRFFKFNLKKQLD